MARDSNATKARLLDAAFSEFATYGIAGARVDRIAEAAQANKRLIYVYYGNKEQLFDAVLQRALETGSESVPFDADDLPRRCDRGRRCPAGRLAVPRTGPRSRPPPRRAVTA
ncbi:TetR/AcrR family transcriptional regulator, partial [Streptomyces virginiae]|uniref:TetR/AcrR family transcriptional regulator n=1 Tax=Streptomyces virginiae TaxID=1961 RepID=UPI003F4F1AE1